MLMAMYGIDSEEGEDIPQQGKSYFLDLLQQGVVMVNPLRWFNSSLQTTRSCWSSSSTMRSRSTSTRRRGTRGREQRPNLPSSSRRRPSSKLDQTCVRSFRVWTNLVFGQHFYLGRKQLISTQALKHQLPLGMLQGIEDRLDDTFSANPNTEYVVEDLSRW